VSIRRIKLLGLLVLFVAVAVANSAVLAQQTTGTPGSPGATTTIDGRYLPAPPPKFGGEMNLNALESKPWWPPRVVPPKPTPWPADLIPTWDRKAAVLLVSQNCYATLTEHECQAKFAWRTISIGAASWSACSGV